MQVEDRIIVADDNNGEPVLEVTALKLGDRPLRLNEIISADENWLKNVKITVKNVGNRDIKFLLVTLGLLDTVDYKMRPEESWGYNMVFSYGNYGKRKPNGKGLKKRAEIELTYEHVDPSFRDLLESAPFGKFHKAVLEWATVVYKGGEEDDILLRLPKGTIYLKDRSY